MTRVAGPEQFWAEVRRANELEIWETAPVKTLHRRRRRHIHNAVRWQTVLVIGLCFITLIAVVGGLIYDKSRLAEKRKTGPISGTYVPLGQMTKILELSGMQ